MADVAIDCSKTINWCKLNYPKSNEYLGKLGSGEGLCPDFSTGLSLFIHGVCNLLFNPYVVVQTEHQNIAKLVTAALWSFQNEGMSAADGDSLLPLDLTQQRDEDEINDYFSDVAGRFLSDVANSGIINQLDNGTGLYATQIQSGLVLFDYC